MGSLCTAGNFLRLVTVILTVVAVALQWFTQYLCNYALYKKDESSGIGVWYKMADDECGKDVYDPDDTDPFISAARGCLTIAMILGAIGGILVALEWCCCEVCCATCFQFSAFSSACLFAALVNLIYACELCTDDNFDNAVDGLEAAASSDAQCKNGPASTLNAISTAIYAVCCVLLCCTGAPEPAFKREH